MILVDKFSFQVDRSPSWIPIADCREGRNVGLTVYKRDRVSIDILRISEPNGVSNVDHSQLWCIKVQQGDCECKKRGRGHIQNNGEAGTIINKETCNFIKAAVPTSTKPGLLTLTNVKH